MRIILLTLLIASSAYAQRIDLLSVGNVDPYTTETIRLLHELREAGELGSIEMQELSDGDCQILAGNILMGGTIIDRQKFIKDCKGKSISLMQQVEAPELPLFVDIAIVTYWNYGNIPFAVADPAGFFANGNFYYEGIVANAKQTGCANREMIQEEKIEIASRFMVNEILAYDVRITYKEMGIISIRYFLDGDYNRHDFNYTCE